MKNRLQMLTSLLLITSISVAAFGGYIKYGILKPLGIETEENIFAMPFVYITDDGLQFMVQMRKNIALQEDSTQSTASNNDPDRSPTATTEEIRETVLETELPTLPSTEAPTEPDYEPVKDSWFDDALFIGDSRLHALRAYNRMGEATYFTRVGLNIYNVFNAWESDRTYVDMQLEQLLMKKKFNKILISIGLNGCEYEHDYIRAGFEKLIAMIQQHQPDAKIILMSIMMVSDGYSTLEPYFSIENLTAINEIIASFADDETIFYMDSNAWIVNEEGYLPDSVSNDGVHLQATGYAQWADWIRKQCGSYQFD